MTRFRGTCVSLFVTALTLAFPAAGRAASLQQVSNWGGPGLPSDVTMYVYVPNKVATNPPVLTLIHYFGGTASAVFGQAQGGGLVSAADQYGFIMVVPSSGRCWDVESDKAWTRSGGGDSDAIKQMVTYAISKYGANADRVYSTGDSSGAMMTELLLAVYPDVFKGGSAFAGMPAGCRGSGESATGSGYSNACAGGSVMHTAQEWGDIVRKMDPGYAGHRPRVQLFHGSADTTINQANLQQAILEWTNVLGLSATPTSTTMNVPLGTHQATRQQWLNSCGYLVLDTFLSINGDHGPSDALFESQYVVPFLGLDKVGAVDPEIAQCGSAGAGGGAGAAGHAGAGGAGGGGQAGKSGSGTGGAAGGKATGGAGGGAGSSGEGGRSATGGQGTGGQGTGGQGTGGQVGSGGGSATGGNPGAGTGGVPGTGGETGGSMGAGDTGSGGCSCAVAATGPRDLIGGLLLLCLLHLLLRGSRRRRRSNQANVVASGYGK